MADIYLKIDGIKGDATDEKHKDQIEVQAFTHAINQPTGGPQTSAGGLTGGRVIHGEFEIEKRMDASSPMLFLACSTGDPIKQATLTLRRSAKDQKVFMTYVFDQLIISSVECTGSTEGDDAIPNERIKIRYDKITLEYTPVDSAGKEGSKVKAGWDVAKNKKV